MSFYFLLFLITFVSESRCPRSRGVKGARGCLEGVIERRGVMRISLLPSLRAKCGLPTPLIQLVPGAWTLPLAQPWGWQSWGLPWLLAQGLVTGLMSFEKGDRAGPCSSLPSSSTEDREQPGPGLAVLGGQRGWEQPQSRGTPILWCHLGEEHLREQRFAFCASLAQLAHGKFFHKSAFLRDRL